MTMESNEMTDASADYQTRTSEAPVVAMIIVSMALWVGLIFLVPVAVVIATVLMILLAIVQVALSPWLMSMRLSRRQVRYEF